MFKKISFVIVSSVIMWVTYIVQCMISTTLWLVMVVFSTDINSAVNVQFLISFCTPLRVTIKWSKDVLEIF